MRDEFAKQPNLRVRLARGWMIVGSLLVVVISVMAVAHYVYGVPIHDKDTGQFPTPENTLTTFLIIGGGGRCSP